MKVDITDQRFGRLVAKYPVDKAKNGSTRWYCICDCGRTTKVEIHHLKRGDTKTCGQCSRLKFDLTGQRFGRLVVLKRVQKQTTNGTVFWLCRCDCGNLKEAESYRLRHQRVRSCGCLRRETATSKIYENPATASKIGNHDGFKDQYGNAIQSVRKGARNRSGVIGVSFDEFSQRWVAKLMIKGEMVLNSSFKEFEDAVAARKAAELKFFKKKVKG